MKCLAVRLAIGLFTSLLKERSHEAKQERRDISSSLELLDTTQFALVSHILRILASEMEVQSHTGQQAALLGPANRR